MNPDDTSPIAAVLADVDGTLVTKQKVLTPRTAELAVQKQYDTHVSAACPSRTTWT
jgi:hydroxymethylpyrimidine pyrophosphatase-like HAD family hydrolase